MTWLLAIWFLVSFGCGILGRETLDQWMLPGTGFPLGFWFAQQGAIYVFVLLVGIYVLLASRIDALFEAERTASEHAQSEIRAANQQVHGEQA